MTEQELNDELDKCHKDPVYFAAKYCCIINEKGESMKMSLRDYQKKFLADWAIKGHAIVGIKKNTGKQ
jgi:hypothetical protein